MARVFIYFDETCFSFEDSIEAPSSFTTIFLEDDEGDVTLFFITPLYGTSKVIIISALSVLSYML
jgi:hypothetical protein